MEQLVADLGLLVSVILGLAIWIGGGLFMGHVLAPQYGARWRAIALFWYIAMPLVPIVHVMGG